MDTASPWNPLPWLAITALCLLCGDLIARSSAFYQRRLAEERSGRVGTLDGLRGYLALAVFGAHAVRMYYLHTQGQWDYPLHTFHTAAAEAGVSLFFMITAFLFWRQALASGPKFNAAAFLRSRIRRLTPMYLASVALAMLVVLAASGFALNGGPMQFAKELRPWLSFGFMTTGDINGLRDAHAINAVYWTLAYEWMFYLLLPLVAIFARGWAMLAVVAIVLFFGIQSPIVLNFLWGALAASAAHHGLLRGRLAAPHWTPIPLVALAIAVGFGFDTVYAVVPQLLLLVFFVHVVDGNTLFGLLRLRGSRFLGVITYSIFLTHCITVYVVIWIANQMGLLAGISTTRYWSLAAIAALAAVALSTATYRYIEYPFLRKPNPADPARAVVPEAVANAISPSPTR